MIAVVFCLALLFSRNAKAAKRETEKLRQTQRCGQVYSYRAIRYLVGRFCCCFCFCFFFHFVGVAVSALVLIYQQQFEFVPTLRLQSPFINGLRDNYIGIFGVHSVCCCCCLSTSYTLLTAAAATTTHLRVGMPMLCEWL